MQIHDVEQGTLEWHALRLGRITGSNFYKLMGTPLAREKYIYDLASERITGSRSDGDSTILSGVHINRGNEFEDIARKKYESVTFSEVTQTGFISGLDYLGYCGYSPDGLVGEDGMIEIKVPDSNNYLRQVIGLKSGMDIIPSQYKWQMYLGMLLCGTAWCDYVLYNPLYEEIDKSIYITRVHRDENIILECKQVITEAQEEIKKILNRFLNE